VRRVVIQLPDQETTKLGNYTIELSREVESLDVIHHVKHGIEGSAVVCRVRPKDSFKDKVAGVIFKFTKFEVLSQENDGLIVYIAAEAAPMSPGTPNPPKVYLNFPFEVRAGNRRVTFLGYGVEIKKLFRWFKKNRVNFEVLSNTDARFSPNSLLHGLTHQQRNALHSAYAGGYYEQPRKVNLDALARKQNVNKSTFAEHLLKAENYTISRAMADEPSFHQKRS
jgi:hypothetical protein